jgi:4,4'-diaponeurosporenoate glycosyltransferase
MLVPLALATATLVVGALLLAGLRPLRLAPAVDHPASVSIVIPARDEAGSLPALLASIASLAPEPLEVIVVDDGSRDDTAAIAAAAGAVVLAAPEVPVGCFGKPSACWHGAQHARGDQLLFLDADVTVAPDALARLSIVANDGLVSVQPFHRAVRPYESLSAPFNLVSMLGSGAFAAFGREGAGTAFGPCLLTSRTAYFAVGGHASVAADVVEDIALAQRYRDHGLPVACHAGGRTIAFRMYPGGIASLLEGWTKNLAAGAGRARRTPVLLAVLAVAAAAAVAGGAIARAVTRSDDLAGWAVAYAVVAAAAGGVLRCIGRFRWWAWALYPAPLAVFVGVFLRSMWVTVVRREVVWRGRRVRLGGARVAR